MNFRMITIEKWITFLLLFILVIASFNIISSLSMLVIEKDRSSHPLRAIGFSRNRIGSIFFWESIFVTMAGGASGICLGVALTLSFRSISVSFGCRETGHTDNSGISEFYLDPTDILLTLLPITVIRVATALITASYAKSRTRNRETVVS